MHEVFDVKHEGASEHIPQLRPLAISKALTIDNCFGNMAHQLILIMFSQVSSQPCLAPLLAGMSLQCDTASPHPWGCHEHEQMDLTGPCRSLLGG